MSQALRAAVRVALVVVVLGPMSSRLATAQEPDDSPLLRWEAFYQERAFPFDRIPAGAFQRALTASLRGAGLRAVPPPISGSSWRSLGPQGILAGLGATGRASAIAIRPDDPNTIYVGGAQGGVWKSTDGGATWSPLTDDQCSLAMGSIAIDPASPDIVYAGTGEQHFSGDSYFGCGILRTTDGGASWTQLGGSVFRTHFLGARIARVVINPWTAGSVAHTSLLVASDFGLYRSPNGGESWGQVLSGTATDVLQDPTDSTVAWAAVRGQGVYKSTDAGATWTKVAGGFPNDSDVGRINIALSSSDPRVLYASVARNTSELKGIWKTVDGGDTWRQVQASGASCGTQCWYDMALLVHPSSPDTLYFGGIGLYKSTDGGASFTFIGAPHPDQHFFATDPVDPNVVYVANDGGIYRSQDGGGTWSSLNTNLALTQFYPGVSLHPSDPDVIMGGTQDNGTLEYTGSSQWLHRVGGDGGYTAIDPLQPTTRYAETQWIANNSSNGPRRSDGGGFLPVANGIDRSETALFIPPLVMDPVDPRVLYFGTRHLYRTSDRGESWSAISPLFGVPVSAIAPSVSNPAVVYAGTTRGEFWRTTDAGATWNEVDTGLPVRYTKSIAVDPVDWRTVYVAFSGFGTGHVFQSTDAGATWSDVTGNMPDTPVNAILIDPAARTNVFAGTDVGVYMSNTSGKTWTLLAAGMPHVAIFDLAYNSNTGVLVAATHGRGMFALNLQRPLTLAMAPFSGLDSIPAGAAPVDDSATVVVSGTGSASAEWAAAVATHGWISLSTDAGTGTSRVRWRRDPGILAPGTYVDTVTITAGGAIDSPFDLVDTLVVYAPLAVSVSAAAKADTVLVGSGASATDSVAVTLSGAGAATSSWVATHGPQPWLNLVDSAGAGSGTVRWRWTSSTLDAGTYVDTIVVTTPGTLANAVHLPVSLWVARPLFATLSPTDWSRGVEEGAVAAGEDSAIVTLGGLGADTASWVATHGASSWLTLVDSAGTGAGALRWTWAADGLRVASYADTVTVRAGGGVVAQLLVTLTLTAPLVDTDCAARHLLGQSCLQDTQLRYLDMEGNADGAYDLGDFLAHLQRASARPAEIAGRAAAVGNRDGDGHRDAVLPAAPVPRQPRPPGGRRP